MQVYKSWEYIYESKENNKEKIDLVDAIDRSVKAADSGEKRKVESANVA